MKEAQTHLFSGYVEIRLKRKSNLWGHVHKKGNLQLQDLCQHNILFLLYDNVTKDKIHVLKSGETFNVTFERKKYVYLQTAVISHFESVSIFLYEVIVHTTDHPLVIIQNLSLRRNA